MGFENSGIEREEIPFANNGVAHDEIFLRQSITMVGNFNLIMRYKRCLN